MGQNPGAAVVRGGNLGYIRGNAMLADESDLP